LKNRQNVQKACELAENVEKMLCSPTKMKNMGISINNFKLGADISNFLVIGAEKKI